MLKVLSYLYQMKICSICKQEKELTEFHKNKVKKDGVNNICKPCRVKYHKNWYDNGKKDIVMASNHARKKKIRQVILEYLQQNPCVDCGEHDPVVLEFDHQKDKEFNISESSNRNLSIKRVFAEIEKCEVVCANCHKRRTAKTQNWFKS